MCFGCSAANSFILTSNSSQRLYQQSLSYSSLIISSNNINSYLVIIGKYQSKKYFLPSTNIKIKKQIILIDSLNYNNFKMLGGIALGKKIIRRKQQVRLQEGHLQRLKNARPSTTGYDWQEGPRILNNGKKQMLIQNKFTQIQRQNRLLLQKITTNLNKRNSKQLDGGRERMNKSLHSNFRKKQLQNIEIQNARLLRRIQQKKSDYQTQKLHQDWKKQKAVIKNIANFPIVISDGSRKQKRRAYSRGLNIRPSLDRNSMNDEIEMMRIRKIDEINMVITVKLNSEHLTIIGDTKRGKDIKVIQVPRDEAIQFINEECDGKIQKIFDRLHYDGKDDLLYLLAKDAEIGNPQDNIQEAPLLSQQ